MYNNCMDFKQYLEQYYSNEDVKKILDSFSQKRTNSFILNINKYCLSQLNDIEVSPHPYIKNAFYFNSDVNKLGTDYRFDNGMFYIQDASAMMPVHCLGIRSNEIILDMCAAPGGKTIDAAIELNNTGAIIANDLSYERARTLSSNIEKMGFSNVVVTNNDFTKIYPEYCQVFDKIILDAPCSGSFMFRKNENAKDDWTYEKVIKCNKTQTDLLSYAAYMLKPGGKISYSTCSLCQEENEQIIKEFLSINSDFHLVHQEFGQDVIESEYLSNTYYFMPHLFKGEGQFLAILEKDGSYYQTDLIYDKKPILTDIEKKFNLDFSSYRSLLNENYVLNKPFDLRHLKILRYGLHVSTTKGKIEIPSFHLAHFLPSNISIELDENERKKYLHGEELSRDNIQDGFYVVSYNGLNLGFVKASQGKLKNYYPKGLRQ